jgi:hypothetical protein
MDCISNRPDGWFAASRRFGCCFLVLVVAAGVAVSRAQEAPATGAATQQPSLPEAPQPQTVPQAKAQAEGPCPVAAPGTAAAAVATNPTATAGGVATNPCKPEKRINWYDRFIDGPQVKPLKPKEKLWLAVRNMVDPFNALTIVGEAGIAVGSDPDSVYGPGMPGFGRYVGVSYTQDISGEFICTFLVPSIVGQDPHYHRMPNASIPRRAGHAILQVVWTQGDNGKGMLNYGDIVGAAATDEIGNLYVPGRETNLPASAERYATGLATAPIDNFVSEFLPDVARHIHIQIVVIQRIINQVAKQDGVAGP